MNEHAISKTIDSNLLFFCVLFSFIHLIRFAYKSTHTVPREDRVTYFNFLLTVCVLIIHVRERTVSLLD